MNSKRECIFCNISKSEIIRENNYAYAIYDINPVSKYHILVIPTNHVEDFFSLSKNELLACYDLIKRLRDEIIEIDNSVTGFNIGANNGSVAGQSIFHCHIHLIPRRRGDSDNYEGGVRNVINSKEIYK